MASASATVFAGASSSLSAPVPPKKYDVFISFRGEDTRDNFTSHLHAALCRNNIVTYIDNRLDKGDEVWPTLVQAIKDSSVFLVIFSENYASSTWCLNELIEIMECKQKGQDVIPVFYRIDPSHLRKLTGSYHTAFSKHEKDLKHNNGKVLKWRAALSEIANIVGFHSPSYRTENDLIEEIIKAVLRKLNHECSYEPRGHLILDENYAQVQLLLRNESREVQIIGIWGMGGIGKTTIATVFFHSVSSQYEGSCFLANVREESERNGPRHMCSRLFSELLKENVRIDTPQVISSSILNRLRRKKVLIVLDEVSMSTCELLEILFGAGHDCLGAGSRVIVTTRNKDVLTSNGVNIIHEVKKMNDQNSLQLFSLNAFGKAHPKSEYWELSKKAVDYAKGIPLALKVLGSFLCSKSENEWNSELKKLEKIPNAEIQKVLMLSYNELDDTEKKIFLDIACFFEGNNTRTVTRILNSCDLFADIGIRNLLDKALITINSCYCIQMHDLIQQMGREIVHKECSNNPGQRSRLWDPQDVCDVLENNRGTDKVESILFDMTHITYLNLSLHAFEKMPNLRLLALNGDININGRRNDNLVCLKRDLKLPNNLRYFKWESCPLKSLPIKCWPTKLVILSMRFSNVEKLWDGVQNLPNLEEISLSCSDRLIEFPNLSGASNLKVVELCHCDSLRRVHPSIFSLQQIKVLLLFGCKSIKSLCGDSCSPSLRVLDASNCPNLQKFSVPISGDRSMHLDLRSTALNELPPSIFHARGLSISFPISKCLMDLPENFANRIWLYDHSKYGYDASVTLHMLLPSPVFRYVKCLSFMHCGGLFELPDNISLLSSLEFLDFSYSNVISLPASIKYLPRLTGLNICRCKMLQSVPVLPQSIEWFNAMDCISLKIVLSSTSEPSIKRKCTLLFLNCINLDQDAYDNILKDAIVRIELGAKLLSSIIVLEDKEYAYEDGDDVANIAKVYYCLPARSNKVREWFHYCSTQALITNIEVPPNSEALGFVFYFVIPPEVNSMAATYHGRYGCECYLETSWGESIKITSSFFSSIFASFKELISFANKFVSDNVFLWYDAHCCKQIMEEIKQRKAIIGMCSTYNPKLTFKFFALTEDNKEVVIKDCGIRLICPCAEGFEFDEPEELVPPTNNFKEHPFGTSSNLQEGQETEDLRPSLEEILHIGFGRGFV